MYFLYLCQNIFIIKFNFVLVIWVKNYIFLSFHFPDYYKSLASFYKLFVTVLILVNIFKMILKYKNHVITINYLALLQIITSETIPLKYSEMYSCLFMWLLKRSLAF